MERPVREALPLPGRGYSRSLNARGTYAAIVALYRLSQCTLSMAPASRRAPAGARPAKSRRNGPLNSHA